MKSSSTNRGENSFLKPRKADLESVVDIYKLIRGNPDELIVRPIGDIVRNIDRFFVIYRQGKLAGCVSYTILPEAGDFTRTSIEISSLVVRDDMRGLGIGRRLVAAVVGAIRDLHVHQIIALTLTPGFFRKLDFVEIPKTEILHKIYTGCINCMKHTNPFTCPEVAMVYTPHYKEQP